MSKLIKVSILTLLAYLLQATVANPIAIGGVAPNLAFALIAVATVALGRKYAFVMSMIVGYLLEIMLPALDYISLIAYPVCAMLGALFFSDKSERRLEEERTQGKRTTQLNPLLRTLLCAGLSTAVFEGVNLIYAFLGGVTIDGPHMARAVFSVVYTIALTGILQFPVRRWLGIHKLPKAR